MIIELSARGYGIKGRIDDARKLGAMLSPVFKDLREQGHNVCFSVKPCIIEVKSDRPVDATLFTLKYPQLEVRLVDREWRHSDTLGTEFIPQWFRGHRW